MINASNAVWPARRATRPTVTIDKSANHSSGEVSIANNGNQLVLASLKSRLTESQLAEIIAAAGPTSSSSPSASSGAQAKDAVALDNITRQFQQRFAGQAGNRQEFHNLLKKSFGSTYDASKAETIRKQTLSGDFSWMPGLIPMTPRVTKEISSRACRTVKKFLPVN